MPAIGMAVKVKICGVKTAQDIAALIEAGADYAGFVFVEKSPRTLTLDEAKKLAALVPKNIAKVALLVNPDNAALEAAVAAIKPDYLQLHGNESVLRVKDIKIRTKLPVIKAFGVHTIADFAAVKKYEGIADMFLFDAKSEEYPLSGGNGIAFDWTILKHFNNGTPSKTATKTPTKTPWMLSGGLTPDNVASAIAQTGARMVDVSSGVESTRGIKNPALIAKFISAAKS